MLKVLDLFSGIGGFSLGLEKTGGFETVAFCETDLACTNVLNNHWPDVPVFDDIRNLEAFYLNGDFNNPPNLVDISGTFGIETPIDIICGGYPCTGHSVAGKKEGFKNEASNLWLEYKRLIGGIRPRYVIIENSPNLRNTGLGEVLKGLHEEGYNAEWQIISAYSVGSPHQRERIYIVAWRQDIPYPDPFRCWPTYIKAEKTKSEWRAETKFKRDVVFEQVGEITSEFCINVDGFSKDMVMEIEERIRQLGNAVVPQIVQLIGKGILEHESTL